MRIIKFKENQKEIWNEFIAKNNSEGFLQSWEWGSFQKSLGRRVWRMGIVEDGGFHSGDSPVEPKMQDLHMRFHSPNGTMEPSESQINSKFKIQNSNLVAVALIVKHDLPFGRSYIYCPRGPVIKELRIKNLAYRQAGQESRILNFLFNEVKKISKKEKAMFLRIDPATPLTPTLSRGEREHAPPFKKGAGGISSSGIKKSSDEIQPKDTLMLDLKKSEEELLKEMKQKTRYNIRLARKKELRITNYELRIDNKKIFEEKFEEFWKLIKETSERDKFSSHSRNYYWQMLESLATDATTPRPSFAKEGSTNDISYSNLQARLYLAEYENKTIAANIVLFFGDMAVYLHGASSNEYRNLMAPYLLQWRQVLDAKNAGCKRYDFWGIAPFKHTPSASQPPLSRGEYTSSASQPATLPEKTRYGKRGIINPKFNSWDGITRFKKGFGGYEKNYIGAYDLVFSNIGYAIYGFIKFIKSKVR